MLRGNKGEWSELYVLIKLIADGKLYQSNINLEKDPDNVYDIVKGYKDENNFEIVFSREDDILIYKVNDGETKIISRKTIQEFQNLSENLLVGIKSGRGKSFELDSLNEVLEEFELKTVKAKSASKADVKLRIYDHRLAKETDLGFSVKSLLGSDSTLFNPGAGTNFIYEIKNFECDDISKFNAVTYKAPNNISKLTYRLNKIQENNGVISFVDTQSVQLWKNLKMIDGDMPAIMGYALLYRWIYREPFLSSVAELLEQNDPLNFYRGEPSEQKLYEYKIKKFLVESAMGMTAEKPWHGEYDSFGGVIIAKEDGDVVCFHIYDFNLFRTYLLNNTMFEQPSTGEDKDNPGTSRTTGKKYYYGWLYEDTCNMYLKLNLQVRFR